MRDRSRYSRKRSTRPLVVVGTIVTLAVLLPVAASAVDAKSKGPAGASAVRKKTESPAVHHDVSPPLRDIAPAPISGKLKKEKEPKQARRRRSREARTRHPVESGHCRRAVARPRHRGPRPGLQRPGRDVQRRLRAPRSERRRRPEPLRRDRQRELRDLRQVRDARLRTRRDEHAVERLRRRLPVEQRR